MQYKKKEQTIKKKKNQQPTEEALKGQKLN